MPIAPPLGIDPALLAPPSQAMPAMNPVDPLQAALAALTATGALQGPPTQEPLPVGGFADTNLEVPTRTLPIQNAPDYRPRAVDVPDAWEQAVPGGLQYAEPAHLAPDTPRSIGVGTQRHVYGPPPVKPRPLGPVDQATADENAAYTQMAQAQRNAAEAGVAAQSEQANQLGAAYEKSAQEMAAADAQYQQARAAAQQEADLETNAWLQQYTDLAAREPNPSRWWDNQTGLGKALWGLSMLAGAGHVALTPGAQNVALNMVMDNIAKDVQAQKERMTRELEALKLKGQVMDRRHARNLTDASDDHTMALGRLLVLRQAYAARAAAPGDAGKQAALAQADALIGQQIAQLMTGRRQQAVQIREHQIQRNHAAYLAAKQRELTASINAAEIAAKYDLARMQAEAAEAKARSGALADVQGVPMLLGAKMTGSPMGETIQVHKDQAVKMREVFSVANRRYENLRKVRSAMADGSFSERMFMGDPELIGAAKELGYTTAKELDPSGRLSDQDVAFSTAINFGFDPASGVLDKVRFEANLPEIQKMVEQAMQDLPKRVSNQASSYLDPNLVGPNAKILWSPQALHAPNLPAPNATEAVGGIPVSPPADVADYERRLTLEQANPMFRGRQLPQYNQEAVNTFAAGTQGLGPTRIRALAEQALKDYADPWAGTVQGDLQTNRLALESQTQKALKEAEAAVKELNTTARKAGFGAALSGRGEPTLADVATWAARGDRPLTDAPEEIEKALEIAKDAYNDAKSRRWGVWSKK